MLSPMSYVEVSCPESHQKITDFGFQFLEFYEEQLVNIEKVVFIMESLIKTSFDNSRTLGDALLEFMRHAPCLQHCYSETAGGQFGSGDKNNGLAMGLYSLFFNAGAVSGMMALFQQLLIEWGGGLSETTARA